MGYYLRILTKNDTHVPASEVVQPDRDARLEVDEGTNERWASLRLFDANGAPIAYVERNVVEPDTLGADEIQEFRNEIKEARPQSAVDWLLTYLSEVKVIYAIQILNGAYEGDDWILVDQIRTKIQSSVGGIFQADQEGFSNEEGYHILWQFSDEVAGPWSMAVMQNGRWAKFKMELGDRSHRAAFLDGKVPDGAEILA